LCLIFPRVFGAKLGVEANPHHPTEYALNLMQDGITLPDPKWYYSGAFSFFFLSGSVSRS